MSECSDPGATHHTGCECWEKKNKAELEWLANQLAECSEARLGWAREVGKLAAQRADLRESVKRSYEDGARAMKFEMLRIAARLTYDGELWPELMLRLREASVGEDNGRL